MQLCASKGASRMHVLRRSAVGSGFARRHIVSLQYIHQNYFNILLMGTQSSTGASSCSMSSANRDVDIARKAAYPARRKRKSTIPLDKYAPDVAAQWHPTMNGNRRPETESPLSTKTAWWQCDVAPDHVFRASVYNRAVLHTGCPCCRNRQVSVTNRLSTVAPDVAEQWHPTKNGELEPGNIVATSAVTVWWKCAAGHDHEWAASPHDRVHKGYNCPFCNGKLASSTYNLAMKSPETAKEWHPTKNDITADKVTFMARRVVWWRCIVNPLHEWKQAVREVQQCRIRCPFCRARSRSIVGTAPQLHRQWHPTRNYPLVPVDIARYSHVPIWWQCNENPDHVWLQKPARRPDTGACPLCVEEESIS